MEILAVITLISLIFYVGATLMSNNSREELEKVVVSIQKGVRLANDESVIRNLTVRIKLAMDKVPQTLALEYTTQTELLLDNPNEEENSSYGGLLSEQKEQQEKRQKEIDQSFLVNEDFKKNVGEIPESIVLFAAKTAGQDKVTFQKNFYFYFYPNGIRDKTEIYLASIDEFARIQIDAVRDKIDVEYRQNPYGLDDVQNIQKYLQDWSNEK